MTIILKYYLTFDFKSEIISYKNKTKIQNNFFRLACEKKRTLNFHQGSFYSCLVRLVSCPLCIICANTSSYFIHILNNRTCSELASVIAKLNNLFVQQAPPACRLQTCLYATRTLRQVLWRIKKDNPFGLSFLVRSTGLEPAWSYHKILSLARLPIPP